VNADRWSDELLDRMRRERDPVADATVAEMAELPWQESRRLQAELEKIAGEVWPAPAGRQEGPYRRRANVKPRRGLR
jgi:hypothetical protein